MHVVYVLALGTIAIVLGIGLWSWYSTKRNQETGGRASGIGGPNDPMT